jgi:hypothetical protein
MLRGAPDMTPLADGLPKSNDLALGRKSSRLPLARKKRCGALTMLDRVLPIPNEPMALAARKPSRARALLRTLKSSITRILKTLGELIEAGGPLS